MISPALSSDSRLFQLLYIMQCDRLQMFEISAEIQMSDRFREMLLYPWPFVILSKLL